MRIYRFAGQQSEPRLAALTDEHVLYALPYNDLMALVQAADEQGKTVSAFVASMLPECRRIEEPVSELNLLTPVDAPEVWAAGVTYERSRDARNYEATGGKLDATTFYDEVYDAERPEIFLKSTSARTVGPGREVCLRSDSNWQVPEPELALVLDGNARIIGYTVGNDMSCRDIEGENPLYLPQAKVWRGSCSIGPAVLLAETVADPYDLDIECAIYREDQEVFRGSANTKQLKRKLDELVSYLARDNDVFPGTVLMTGTCIVPPNDFTLAEGDRIEISISGIGTLVNPVARA